MLYSAGLRSNISLLKWLNIPRSSFDASNSWLVLPGSTGDHCFLPFAMKFFPCRFLPKKKHGSLQHVSPSTRPGSRSKWEGSEIRPWPGHFMILWPKDRIQNPNGMSQLVNPTWPMIYSWRSVPRFGRNSQPDAIHLLPKAQMNKLSTPRDLGPILGHAIVDPSQCCTVMLPMLRSEEKRLRSGTVQPVKRARFGKKRADSADQSRIIEKKRRNSLKTLQVRVFGSQTLACYRVLGNDETDMTVCHFGSFGPNQWYVMGSYQANPWYLIVTSHIPYYPYFIVGFRILVSYIPERYPVPIVLLGINQCKLPFGILSGFRLESKAKNLKCYGLRSHMIIKSYFVMAQKLYHHIS